MGLKDVEAKRKYAREWQKKWRKANPEKARALDKFYRRKYKGEPQRKYYERNKDARNADSLKRWHKNSERYRRAKYDCFATRPMPLHCEACKELFKKAACFDHDHSTGKFRGWLCNDCNLALGLLKDSRQRIQGLVGYLDMVELIS
jgi:hypothetical protein